MFLTLWLLVLSAHISGAARVGRSVWKGAVVVLWSKTFARSSRYA